jgi:hypothetical protein
MKQQPFGTVDKLPPGRRSKYLSEGVHTNDGFFHSKKEARRWSDLLWLKHAGNIRELARQVRFALKVNGEHIAFYVADFVYRDTRTDELIVEDVKSPATKRLRDYQMKKKLMKALYNVEILET